MRSEQPRIPAEGVKVEVEYPTYTPAAQAPPPGRLYYQPDVPTAFYAAQPHPYQAPDANEQRVVREQRMSQREVQREVQRNEPPAARPAWLYTDNDPVTAPRTPLPQNIPAPGPHVPSLLTDTLQHSRERVASRWFALKGVFEGQQPEQPEQPVRQKEARTPALVLFSLAGGVGKTSMVATLGRALASLGEKALLTDTTNYGLLRFYFGARELRPGVVRTFSPPSGSTDAPIYLVNYDTEQKLNDASQDWLVDEIARNSRGANRVILDLGTGSAALLRRLTRLNPTVLVPVSPDMNSVISIANVDKAFQGLTNADGRPIQPMYLLNQFDASLPLHLDVREVMRQQLGDRLLPFVIRRSPAVSEALAEGMTVIDYAPNSPVAEDYMNLAAWVRNVSAPAAAAFRGVRWSER
jgi:cellulose synthase operon protein YhjQ